MYRLIIEKILILPPHTPVAQKIADQQIFVVDFENDVRIDINFAI